VGGAPYVTPAAVTLPARGTKAPAAAPVAEGKPAKS
jgi:hypothetical protein